MGPNPIRLVSLQAEELRTDTHRDDHVRRWPSACLRGASPGPAWALALLPPALRGTHALGGFCCRSRERTHAAPQVPSQPWGSCGPDTPSPPSSRNQSRETLGVTAGVLLPRQMDGRDTSVPDLLRMLPRHTGSALSVPRWGAPAAAWFCRSGVI